MPFEPIKLNFLSGEKLIGTVSVSGDCDETDFYSLVSVQGLISEKRIYGVDPISAFGQGCRLVETLTEELRFNEKLVPSDLSIVVERL